MKPLPQFWTTEMRFRLHALRNVSRGVFLLAVREGRMVRSNVCEECGAEGYTEGHHEDYCKPLDVQYLCRKCHGAKRRGKPYTITDVFELARMVGELEAAGIDSPVRKWRVRPRAGWLLGEEPPLWPRMEYR